MVDYERIRFPYRRHADQDASAPVRRPVVVVGAGPVGLTLAIDLALQGVRVVLLNNDGRLSTGSRALCFAKRTLEVWDRLGCGQRVVDRGVSWQVGRVFFGDEQVYQFDLLADAGHRRPAFVNLQQYYVEGFLVERAQELQLIDLRWHHGVTAVGPRDDHVALTVDTPEGSYELQADYVVACDGARSTMRRSMGLEPQGRTFQDRFLIADVRMQAPFPAERWFWFDPPFHRGGSVLLHRQADGVWRIDFQLGWDADPDHEKQPEQILPRVRRLMAQASRAAGGDGSVPEIELVWASVYTFSCMRLDRFRHGRVLFAGDAAHGVSPFGARGANSGVQDADHLAWRLAWVLRGEAPASLLDRYADEREAAADENIRQSTRSTDFITPKSAMSRVFRDATLSLARETEFARRLVNSGRLSVPMVLPGAVPALDAPVRRAGRPAWLLEACEPGRFTALVFEGGEAIGEAAMASVNAAFEGRPACKVVRIVSAFASAATSGPLDVVEDVDGLAHARYDATAGTVVLLRPDQQICARWWAPTSADVREALLRVLDAAPWEPATDGLPSPIRSR